jgi:anti-sigma factor RsiW
VSEEQAHALLDGELDAEHAPRLREHLAHCRECRVKIGRLRGFLALLRRQRLVPTRAPASLHARVRALRPPIAPAVGDDLHPPDEPA